MDLFDVFRACIRRWYVAAPLLLVTLWYSYHTYSTVKPVYYSNAIIGIAAPNSQVPWGAGGEAIPQNGLLAAGGPALLAQMLVFGLGNVDVINQVVANGGTSSYSVRLFPTGGDIQSAALPLVMVESTQPDPATAKRTVELASANANPVLRKIQQEAGVPESLMVQTLVASPPGPPRAGTPSRTRSTFGIFAAGFGATILAAVLVDVIMLRRRTPRQPGESAASLTKGTRHARSDRVV